MKPEMKEWVVIILFMSFCLLAVVDKELTNVALDNGFYETNDFTNATSITTHFNILLFFVGLITIFSVVAINYNFTIFFFLSLLNIIWLINNIISRVLLSHIL